MRSKKPLSNSNTNKLNYGDQLQYYSVQTTVPVFYMIFVIGLSGEGLSVDKVSYISVVTARAKLS